MSPRPSRCILALAAMMAMGSASVQLRAHGNVTPQAVDTSGLEMLGEMVPAFSASLSDEKQRGQEAQPIVYDGIIYFTGSCSRLFAFDARTGEAKWQYDAPLPDGIMPCCDVVNRGAAIHGDRSSSARWMPSWSHWTARPAR